MNYFCLGVCYKHFNTMFLISYLGFINKGDIGTSPWVYIYARSNCQLQYMESSIKTRSDLLCFTGNSNNNNIVSNKGICWGVFHSEY